MRTNKFEKSRLFPVFLVMIVRDTLRKTPKKRSFFPGFDEIQLFLLTKQDFLRECGMNIVWIKQCQQLTFTLMQIPVQ